MMDNNRIFIDYSKVLPRDFFRRPAPETARSLIGKIFVKKSGADYLAARIVETEAYLDKGDPASHSAPGLTPRNKAMFGSPGTLYIYKIYGIHRCVNFVCSEKGVGTAVLIRAAEPLSGIDIMAGNRGTGEIRKLCKGPGNFAKAFGIDVDMNYMSLNSPKLFVMDAEEIPHEEIAVTSRIGISKAAELPLRYYHKPSKFISGRR